MTERPTTPSSDPLPRNFYRVLDELTEQTLLELDEAGPEVFDFGDYQPLLLSDPAGATLAYALAQGYESHSSKVCSGNARMWAAWALGEVGFKGAVPVFERNLRRERSLEARLMYHISLARLAPDRVPAYSYLSRLKTASLSATKWTKMVPFRLGTAGVYDFYLSERAAAMLVLGYSEVAYQRTRLAVEMAMLDELDKLLSPEEAWNPVTGARVRRWGFYTDTHQQSGPVGNLEAYLPVILFAIGQRAIPQAYGILAKYFHSIGTYVLPEAETSRLRAHTVPTQVLVAAMYRIDRERTLGHLEAKIREGRVVNSVEGGTSRFRYALPALWDAAENVLSEQHYTQLQRRLAQ